MSIILLPITTKTLLYRPVVLSCKNISGIKLANNEREFREGVQRGLAGKSDSQPLLDANRIFDSNSDRAARERGFEAGVAARATAAAMATRAATNQGSSSSGGGSGDTDHGVGILLFINPVLAALGGLLAFLLAAGVAFFGRTVVAAAIKAIGGSRRTVEYVLTADVWQIAAPFGVIMFSWLLIRSTITWFGSSRNRQHLKDAIGMTIFIAMWIGGFVILFYGWRYLKAFTAA